MAVFKIKQLTAVFVMLAAGAGGLAAPVFAPYSSSTDPLLDGKLDDAVWNKTSWRGGFRRSNGKAPTKETSYKLIYTPNGVWVGIRCDVQDQQLPDEAQAKSQAVYQTECVDVMISPTESANTYRHFILNRYNMRYSRVCEQGGYIGRVLPLFWKSAVHRGDGVWSAEIQIPYATLGITGREKIWRLNIGRENHVIGEVSCLTENGAFNNSGAFVRMCAPAFDLDRYAVDLTNPIFTSRLSDGKLGMKLSGRVTAPDGRHAPMKCSVTLTGPGGQKLRTVTTLPADESVLAFPEVMLEVPGKWKMNVLLRENSTNRIVLRKYLEYNADFAPLSIELTSHAYRNMIFATQPYKNVEYKVTLAASAPGKKLTTGIRLKDKGKVFGKKVVSADKEHSFAVPVKDLPAGKLEIFAGLEGTAEEITEPLTKLLPSKSEYWRGADGNWYYNGKKRFLLLSWSTSPRSAGQAFSIVSGNISDTLPTFSGLMFGLGKHRADLKQGKYTPEFAELLRSRIKRAMNDSQTANRIHAHYSCDEPDGYGISAEILNKVLNEACDTDPYHPVIISTGGGGLGHYDTEGEINGFHCYPSCHIGKMFDYDELIRLMDAYHPKQKILAAQPTIAYMHQGFSFADCGQVNARIPTYREYRNQNLMAFILGARALLHYNRTEESYPELYIGMPELAAEQRIIGDEMIIQPEAAIRAKVSDPRIRIMTKQNSDNRHYWIIAGNFSKDPLKVKIDFPPWRNKSVPVVSENRQAVFKGTTLTESFGPYEIRVYSTSPAPAKLKTVAEIEKAIEAEYRRFNKPGNLAYQRHEGTVLTVRASSNSCPHSAHKHCWLWHLTDGITEGLTPFHYVNRQPGRVLSWRDKTPNQTPDWVEFEFKKPIRTGRVVIYPVADSVKSAEIQIPDANGKMRTVAQRSGISGKKTEFVFDPVTTSRIRVNVTENNGKYTELYEVEVYEK